MSKIPRSADDTVHDLTRWFSTHTEGELHRAGTVELPAELGGSFTSLEPDTLLSEQYGDFSLGVFHDPDAAVEAGSLPKDDELAEIRREVPERGAHREPFWVGRKRFGRIVLQKKLDANAFDEQWRELDVLLESFVVSQ